jgi:hypothetical protein
LESAPSVFGAKGFHLGIVLRGQHRHEGLLLAREQHDAGAAKPKGRAVAFQDAEQAIVAALGAIHAHFVEAGHVAVHGLPLAATAEGGWGRVGYRLHHGHDHGLDLGGARAQELKGRHGTRGIVAGVALEEVHAPRGRVLAGARLLHYAPSACLNGITFTLARSLSR